MSGGRRYSWYVVGVLTLAYIFAYADRQILNLLVGPIRRDLGISDTQMSLLMGFSFVAFFTLFGIPAGRIADTRSRRTLIGCGMLLWSLVTAACGLARQFWHFLLLRMGVGLGEAALNPAAYSLIADYFPAESRAGALGVYGMGIYIGSGVAFIGGGLVVGWAEGHAAVMLPLLGAVRAWQVVFFIVGIAGALAAALLITVREPPRREVRAAGGVATPREVWHHLREHRATFGYLSGGFGLLALSGFSAAAWLPTFFIRTYGWSGARPGLVQGVIVLVFGSIGVVAGGRLSDRFARRGQSDAPIRVGFLAALAWLPAGVLYPLMPSGWWSAALLAPAAFFLAWPFGVAPAAVQRITPNEMRGQMSALYLFAINVIGLGIGPTAVAALTDYVFRRDDAVRYSIVLVTVAAHAGAAILLWKGMARFRASVRGLDAQLVAGSADARGH